MAWRGCQEHARIGNRSPDRRPVSDPPTKVSSEAFVWFPTSEMMMLFAAEIGGGRCDDEPISR
jgi:hypothetical protein